MAVTSVDKLVTRVQGQESGHRTYTSTWRAFTDSHLDGASTVMISTLLPQLGDPYLWENSFDYGARVNSLPVVRLEREDFTAKKQWIVTVTYTTQGRTLEAQPPDDPLSWAWKVSGDADEWVEEATETIPDADGNKTPIMNSAFQQIRGKEVEKFRTRRKWVLSKNFATVNQTFIDHFEGSINRSTVRLLGTVYPPKTLFMRRISFTREWYAYNTPYFPHTFNIDVNPDTFNLKITDKGTMKVRDDGDPEDPQDMVPILDDITKNQMERFLDGAAVPLAKGAAYVILNDPNGFQIYEDEEWNIIGFPQ